MNILEAIAVDLPCFACHRSYRVALDVVAASHRAIGEGCPVANEAVRECPQDTYAKLLDEEALSELERAWKRVEQQLSNAGGTVVIASPAAAVAGNADRLS